MQVATAIDAGKIARFEPAVGGELGAGFFGILQ